MNYSTHLYVGSVLYPVIRENWQIPLSKKRFLYGCVKPDITSLFIRHPHFWKYSKKFFFRKLKKLAEYRPSTDSKNKKFSENLGVALHYAADFFTAAHNVSPNKISEHIEFENQLHRSMLSLVTEDSVREHFRFLRELPALSGDTGDGLSLIEEISRLHKTYRADMSRTSTDINRIIHVSMLISCAIMSAVTEAAQKNVKISV